jgi:DNA-directed RNA polymerase beta subunit
MPFTHNGLTPDIIINPHAFPSRMTLGQLMESVLAKVCVHDGFEYDGIPFEDHDMEYWYSRLLNKYNMHKYGDEVMYNGRTGNMINADIFIGPTYYFRLKHMVGDKINYRTGGRVMGLTRQPTKGRSNEGGLRIGEMETNCLISHGIASFMKESFIERSDKNEIYIDPKNGDITSKNKFASRLLTPYAFKLLLQEIQTMGIMPRVELNEEDAEKNNIQVYEDYYEDASDDEDTRE